MTPRGTGHPHPAFELAALREITSQGFTAHEMADAVGIIHMGGRIYDPRLGRFLQADPFVQAPDNSQNLNRYTYVLNNPLSFIDPSGFFFGKLFRKVLATAIAVTAGILTAGASSSATGFLYAVLGGAAAGGVASGSLNGVLWGAVSGAVFFGIGQGFQRLADGLNGNFLRTGLSKLEFAAQGLSHGVAGGLIAEIQGGKFGHAFISAGISNLLGPTLGRIKNDIVRMAANAVLGGTVSELTGGKFGNGAATAAFSYAMANGLQRQPGTTEQDGPESGLDAPSFGRRLVRGAVDLAGKIWALPNTIVGTVVGLAGVPFGATISFGNNGIQFENYPWGERKVQDSHTPDCKLPTSVRAFAFE